MYLSVSACFHSLLLRGDGLPHIHRRRSKGILARCLGDIATRVLLQEMQKFYFMSVPRLRSQLGLRLQGAQKVLALSR